MDNVIYPARASAQRRVAVPRGVAVAMIVSFLPSRTAARMDPIDAIRSV